MKTAVVIPTRDRSAYLDVALRSIVPQATAAGAQVVVVDDGPDERTHAVAMRHGATYLSHDHSRGLNAARNTAIEQTDAQLLCFTDDDVEVRDGWLGALIDAAQTQGPEAGVFTGPIHVRIEDHRFRTCGRPESAPITELDLGPTDRDAPHAWGANMTVRRSAIDQVGRFDEARELYGDEQEWQDRWRATGGRIRYVAAAGLDHRRAGDDARLRSLCRAAYRRGQASRRFDVHKGRAPTAAAELKLVARTALHGPRLRCANGPVMCAHALGRLRAALAPAPDPAAPDFLSGASGTVGGKRGTLLAVADRLADLRSVPTRRRVRRAARAAPPRRRVLVAGVDRVDGPGLMAAAIAELRRSRHDVTIAMTPGTPGAGKFENLATVIPDELDVDWLIVIDDDIVLPRGFLDAFIAVAERLELRIAQPAHRLNSHVGWAPLRRRAGVSGRETTFVEIGPLTAFARETFATLLPLPSLKMGWGLDAHWSAVAREHGWKIGVVDATPILHTRPAAGGYDRAAAIAEGRAFLAQRPYVTRDEVRTVAVHR